MFAMLSRKTASRGQRVGGSSTMEKGFKSLVVWQKAMVLVRLVYFIADSLPQKEQFALASQIRRSAISIPSNIAEGYRRSTKKDYVQFLHIAHGSLAELETQLLLVVELYPKNSPDIAVFKLIEEVSKMLTSLIAKLKI